MRLTSAQTLRALMEQRGFSYGRLARYAGCNKSFVGHLLTQRRRTCTPQLAERFAEALDVPLALLFVPSTDAAVVRSRSTSRRDRAA